MWWSITAMVYAFNMAQLWRFLSRLQPNHLQGGNYALHEDDTIIIAKSEQKSVDPAGEWGKQRGSAV